jgi:actin-related protein
MIGDEAAKARRLLELSHPLEEGIVKNWEDMELIWKYGFEEKVDKFTLNLCPAQRRDEWSHYLHDGSNHEPSR